MKSAFYDEERKLAPRGVQVMTAITFNYNTAIVSTLFALVVKLPMQVANAAYRSYKCMQAEAEVSAMDAHLLKDIGVARGDIHSRVWGKL